ncbi:DUF2330 domain-containing protein [Luteipulveratus sp. YIM 133132]|uniref:DUF2330 domain-containing protein n=1 Tax=Luteipulveratus flavus TaxID=3031728 RepID=UPI0023B154D4|nr:DUF2330 domain-containing protein [Luteipulveratus sp. YIM 133132]MDE9365338.1 DUF2330 domain-containing protein [Luteipulveratus sp. YIM 133132]
MVTLRRVVVLLMALALSLGAQVVGPAASYACACGAMIPSDATARSAGEIGLVRWYGSTETLTLSMVVRGETSSAAWIMPAPAGAGVTLGEEGLFDRLAAATRPRVEKRYDYWPDWSGGSDGAGAPGGAAGGSPAVVVEGRTTVGPFEVTTIGGTDGGAVTRWLTTHGYPARTDLAPTMQSYLDRGWRLYAVRLTPRGAALRGELSPLRLTFATEEPVYPIRLSRSARSRQSVVLYVAALHRMELDPSTAPTSTATRVRFAGRVDGSVVGGTEGQHLYLTKMVQSLEPSSIHADYVLRQAPSDAEVHEVRYVDVDRTWVGELVILAGFGAALVGLVFLLRRTRREGGPWPR